MPDESVTNQASSEDLMKRLNEHASYQERLLAALELAGSRAVETREQWKALLDVVEARKDIQSAARFIGSNVEAGRRHPEFLKTSVETIELEEHGWRAAAEGGLDRLFAAEQRFLAGGTPSTQAGDAREAEPIGVSLLDLSEKANRELGEAQEQFEKHFEGIGELASHHVGKIGAGAFDVYADAVDKALQREKVSSEAIGRALQNVVASTVRGIGQEASVKGAMQTAEGIAALATHRYTDAGEPFLAAGQYFAVAATAGVVAGALSVKPSGSGGPSRGSGGASRGARGGAPAQVTIVGVLDTAARKELARQLRAEIDEGGM